MQVELTQDQITELARPFVGMVGALREFYSDPQNEKKYREWYLKKYGHEPTDEVH
jgi:hypothetical protein